MMIRKASMLCAMLALAFTIGCENMTPVQKYATGGAVLGAGVGAIAGEVGHGLSTAEAALVGAAGGGLLGALIGDAKDEAEGNARFRAELEAKDAEINRANEAAREAQRRLAAAQQDLENKDREIARLNEALSKCVNERTEITLTADVLFNSGSAVLSAQGRRALDDAVAQIKKSNQFVMVEGHTDTDPIRVSNWKSNWELGAARALAVLHYLIDNGGVDPARCGAATFSQYRPVGTQKAQNRRAVIVLSQVYSNTKM